MVMKVLGSWKSRIGTVGSQGDDALDDILWDVLFVPYSLVYATKILMVLCYETVPYLFP